MNKRINGFILRDVEYNYPVGATRLYYSFEKAVFAINFLWRFYQWWYRVKREELERASCYTSIIRTVGNQDEPIIALS